MPSKTKDARLAQKASFEDQFNRRVADLAGQGLDSATISRDATVRRLRAEMRKTTARLAAIRRGEEKREEMARLKAEKAAAPKKEKEKKKKEEQGAGVSKRQAKKQKKKETKTSEESAEQ
jgi:hypothetical protein